MNWRAFLSTFGLIFIAELGDKTQLAVMAQVCKYRVSLPVFFGGSLALTAVTALGAVGGQVLEGFVPPEVIRLVATLAFVVMGALIWRQASREQQREDERYACADEEIETGRALWSWPAFGGTFMLLFFAELGDKTQLAVLGLASNEPSLWTVFVAGSLALAAVTALGVLCGQQLCRWISERVLLRVAALAFVLLGALMGLGVV